ncbi:MAG: hypothetical protein MJZ34_03030 [Paludibacteraceae bacterium]|nr:hypothetical protein [Paludibacteraceae bacterium]
MSNVKIGLIPGFFTLAFNNINLYIACSPFAKRIYNVVDWNRESGVLTVTIQGIRDDPTCTYEECIDIYSALSYLGFPEEIFKDTCGFEVK